jgi:hypothetical protein
MNVLVLGVYDGFVPGWAMRPVKGNKVKVHLLQERRTVVIPIGAVITESGRKPFIDWYNQFICRHSAWLALHSKPFELRSVGGN